MAEKNIEENPYTFSCLCAMQILFLNIYVLCDCLYISFLFFLKNTHNLKEMNRKKEFRNYFQKAGH